MTESKPSIAVEAAGEAPRAARRRPRAVVIVGVSVALVVVAVVVAGAVLYVRGGGPAPEWTSFLRPGAGEVLKASSPAEAVLRTLRLAGYERAAAGDADGTVVVRIEVPEVRGSADVALTWQTGMAAASAAYPSAKTIVVQVFSRSQSLLEVSAPAAAVASAVKKDDAVQLRAACTFRYLSEAGGG
jgi:uncharacterized membrane protein